MGDSRPDGKDGEQDIMKSETSTHLMSPASVFPIMNPNGDGFQCDVCSKTFRSIRAVNIHYNWKHAKDGRRSRSGSGSADVNFDPTRAARERELDELIDQLIPEVDEEEEEVNTNVFIKEEEEQDVKPHIVDVNLSMGSTVKNEDEFDPGFTCPLCRKQFASEKSLKQHTTWKHSDSGPFNCPICAETFPSKTILNRHTRQKHTLKNEVADETDPEDEIIQQEKDEELNGGADDTRVGCAQCSLSFPKLATLQRHYYWKHTELKDHSTFSVQGKFDESSWNEAVNRLIHRVPPGGAFKCKECQKEFKTKLNAQRHADVHQNLCYLCPLCPEVQTFKTRHSLACHKMRLHARETSRVNGNERCDEDFENEKSLEQHKQEGTQNGRNLSEGKIVAYNIAKKKLILKKMRANAKQQAPSSSTSMVKFLYFHFFFFNDINVISYRNTHLKV